MRIAIKEQHCPCGSPLRSSLPYSILLYRAPKSKTGNGSGREGEWGLSIQSRGLPPAPPVTGSGPKMKVLLTLVRTYFVMSDNRAPPHYPNHHPSSMNETIYPLLIFSCYRRLFSRSAK